MTGFVSFSSNMPIFRKNFVHSETLTNYKSLFEGIAEITHPESIVKKPKIYDEEALEQMKTKNKTYMSRSLRRDINCWEITDLLDDSEIGVTAHQKRAQRTIKKMLQLSREFSLNSLTSHYRRDFPPVFYNVDGEHFPEDKHSINKIRTRIATVSQRMAVNVNSFEEIEKVQENLANLFQQELQYRLQKLRATGHAFNRIAQAFPDAPERITRLRRRSIAYRRAAKKKGTRHAFCANPKMMTYRLYSEVGKISRPLTDKDELRRIEHAMLPDLRPMHKNTHQNLPDPKILEQCSETSVSEDLSIPTLQESKGITTSTSRSSCGYFGYFQEVCDIYNHSQLLIDDVYRMTNLRNLKGLRNTVETATKTAVPAKKGTVAKKTSIRQKQIFKKK